MENKILNDPTDNIEFIDEFVAIVAKVYTKCLSCERSLQRMDPVFFNWETKEVVCFSCVHAFKVIKKIVEGENIRALLVEINPEEREHLLRAVLFLEESDIIPAIWSDYIQDHLGSS